MTFVSLSRKCFKDHLSLCKRCYYPHQSTISPPAEDKPNRLLDKFQGRIKVTVVGGGNWGSAVARKVGFTVNRLDSPIIDPLVKLWLHEEFINGRSLVDIINTQRENIKYLPRVYIPQNVRAFSNLEEAIKESNVLLFVFPHAFLDSMLEQIKAIGIPRSTICVSFIKGVRMMENGAMKRYSEIIQETLEIDQVAAVMGANVANDIANDSFAETTVAAVDEEVRSIVAGLFHSENLKVQVTDDISTVELCGALKNVVALGAGICDGLDMGNSTKAAVIRQGLQEMALFAKIFDKTGRYKAETLFQSCGVADVIATSYGGRNRLCSAEFTRRYLVHYEQQGEEGSEEAMRILWDEIEKDILHGQKLEGVSACKEAVALLEASNYLKKNPSHFPLFRSIYRIVVFGEPYEVLFNWEYY